MAHGNETPNRLNSAIEATVNLWHQRFAELMQEGNFEAHIAHSEIENLSVAQKSGRFYGRFVPLLTKFVTLFSNVYRQYFKLALAHPAECGPDAHEWAWTQVQNAIPSVFEWIQDWYVLACEGENRHVRRIVSIPFVAGEIASVSIPSNLTSFDAASWQAPVWLFAVSPLMGFGPLKTKNVPDVESEGKLSKAQTRLLLKGMRKVFLGKLKAEINTARNEETAAAGTIIASLHAEIQLNHKPGAQPHPKGFDGLGEKEIDYSQLMDNLTAKQRMAFSLRCEYGCSLTDVASRMEIDRKTAYEHVEAARRKVDQNYSNQKRKAKLTKSDFD